MVAIRLRSGARDQRDANAALGSASNRAAGRSPDALASALESESTSCSSSFCCLSVLKRKWKKAQPRHLLIA